MCIFASTCLPRFPSDQRAQGKRFIFIPMTKAAYSKAALTYQQQLEQLKERGLHIPDENYLLHLLEVTSFGSLSVMYRNLKPGREKREIAGAFGLADKVFSSWLHSIVYLRNVCAHHARLWNRVMSIQPLIPRKPRYKWIDGKSVENDKTYYILSMLVYLMNRIKSENDVVERFKTLLTKYPNIAPKAMGFPANWKNEPLWK